MTNSILFQLDVKIDIIRKMQEFLVDIDEEQNIHLLYHLTSIYDNSIYEAFSKIIQKLIRELPILENLLNILRAVSTCPDYYHASNAMYMALRTLAWKKRTSLIL